MRRAWLMCLLATVACGDSQVTLPPALQAVVDASEPSRWRSLGDDPWDVFVCHVPLDTQSLVFAGLPLRSPIRPDTLATLLDDRVGRYFDTLSHGAYRPRFTAGGEVTIAATDEPQACVDMALAATSGQAQGVIAIADAEHVDGQPGGFGSHGGACTARPCLASATRRSVYVGGADFGAQWGDQPPMDLVEHEIGHALGWPHSGYDASEREPNLSAIDLMSNSAAPRDAHPDRRDGPDTLAINRLAAGWLPASSVAVVPPSGATVVLSPSSGTSGTRVVVVELDDHRFITIELLTADGFNDHVPASGVAVHLTEGDDEATRTHTPLVGLPPFDDLLEQGETFTGHGWTVAVTSGWQATVQPVGDGPTVSD